jgi:enamine deaminase RidA (YjgF/YER057c/UK114 family)
MTVSALDIQSTIVSLGLSIRDPAPAFSKNYANYVTDTNGLLYVSGQFSRNVKTGELITGKAGGELSLEAATEAARAPVIAIQPLL